jgi:hypothetical protein
LWGNEWQWKATNGNEKQSIAMKGSASGMTEGIRVEFL